MSPLTSLQWHQYLISTTINYSDTDPPNVPDRPERVPENPPKLRSTEKRQTVPIFCKCDCTISEACIFHECDRILCVGQSESALSDRSMHITFLDHAWKPQRCLAVRFVVERVTDMVWSFSQRLKQCVSERRSLNAGLWTANERSSLIFDPCVFVYFSAFEACSWKLYCGPDFYPWAYGIFFSKVGGSVC